MFLSGREYPMIVPEESNGKTSFVLEAMKIAKAANVPVCMTLIEAEAMPERSYFELEEERYKGVKSLIHA